MRSQHRLYRDAQNDYWEARAYRARRVLAFRRVARIAAILAAVVVVITGAGYVVHRADPGLPIPVFAPQHDYHDPTQLAAAVAEQENVPNVGCSVFLAPQWYICASFGNGDGTTTGWNVIVASDGRSYSLTSRTSVGPNGVTSSPSAKTSAAAAGTPSPVGQEAPSLTGTLTVTEPHNGIQAGSPESLSFGPGNTLAVFNGYSVDLWNTTTRTRIATFTDTDRNAQDASEALAFGPDGTLALGTGNGHVYLWNAATESRIATFTDPGNSDPGVAAVAFGPGGTLAFFDGSHVYLWNTATKNLLATFTDPDQSGGPVPGGSLAFGPDGTLALGSGDVYLWNTATGNLIATLPDDNQNSNMAKVAFGPGGTLAVGDSNALGSTYGAGGSTYLWNIATRAVIATLTDPQGAGQMALAFGPDGTLAVGDGNGNTYLWNTSTGKLAATLSGPYNQVIDAIAFSSGGTLAVGDSDGKVYLWRIPSGNS